MNDYRKIDAIKAILAKGESPEAQAQAIVVAMDREDRQAIREVGAPFGALLTLIDYAEWTLGPDSPGHHPTMPSAVSCAKTALMGLLRGLTGRELDPAEGGPVVRFSGGLTAEARDRIGDEIAEALHRSGYARGAQMPPDIGLKVTARAKALDDLEEVRRAVFGNVGDEPDVYADYVRLSELQGKMSRALLTLRSGKPAPAPAVVPEAPSAPAECPLDAEPCGSTCGDDDRQACQNAADAPAEFGDAAIISGLVEDLKDWHQKLGLSSALLHPAAQKAMAWERGEHSAGNAVTVIVTLLKANDVLIRRHGAKTAAQLSHWGQAASRRLAADDVKYPLSRAEEQAEAGWRKKSVAWPKKGDKLWFHGEAGYDSEQVEAKKYLTVGSVYDCTGCDVGNWSHSVGLMGYSRSFNGSMFEVVEKVDD